MMRTLGATRTRRPPKPTKVTLNVTQPMMGGTPPELRVVAALSARHGSRATDQRSKTNKGQSSDVAPIPATSALLIAFVTTSSATMLKAAPPSRRHSVGTFTNSAVVLNW